MVTLFMVSYWSRPFASHKIPFEGEKKKKKAARAEAEYEPQSSFTSVCFAVSVKVARGVWRHAGLVHFQMAATVKLSAPLLVSGPVPWTQALLGAFMKY